VSGGWKIEVKFGAKEQQTQFNRGPDSAIGGSGGAKTASSLRGLAERQTPQTR